MTTAGFLSAAWLSTIAPTLSAQPTEISTLEQLQAISDDLAGDYILVNDIDALATAAWNWNSGGGYYYGFQPVGDLENQFSGTFNGQSYVISGLYIRRSSSYVGVFGYTAAASLISNLRLEDVEITGGSCTGSIAGFNQGTISGSLARGTVSGVGDVGGLAGHNRGTLLESAAFVAVTATYHHVGGLVGFDLDGVVSDCYARGAGSTAGNRAGGLVGRVYSNSSIIDSYSTGCFTAANEAGGLIGVSWCAVSDCFYDSDTSFKSDTGKGVPKTTAEMMTRATFDPPWDFAAVWHMKDGETYPYLQWQDIPTPSPTPTPTPGGYKTPSPTPSPVPTPSVTPSIIPPTPTPAPHGISGLRRHYAADRISGVNNGGKVSSWADWSPNGEDATQATDAYRPRYYTDQINGLPIVQFAASAQNWLGFAEFDTVDAFTYAVVWSRSDDGDAQVLAHSAGGYPYLHYGDYWHIGEPPGSVELTADTYYLTVGSMAPGGGQGRRWLNTDARGATAGSNSGSAHYRFKYIGLDGYTGPRGKIAEILIYDRVLGDGEREAVEDYLNLKYRLYSTPPPSATPTPSVTPTPAGYKTSTPTPTPSATPTHSPTVTPSVTPTPSVTATPAGYKTATPTPTPLIYITDLAGLQAMRENLHASYRLAGDIDASATAGWNYYTDGGYWRGFEPIGDEDLPFRGFFDGLNYSVTGLYIHRPSTSYIGLFGSLGAGSLVGNLRLQESEIAGLASTGSLAGSNEGTILECSAAGTVSGSGDVGGLVGQNQGEIISSAAFVNVTGTSHHVGGLVGFDFDGSIVHCYARGDGSTAGSRAGGLVGRAYYDSRIYHSYSTGCFTASASAGGLVGYLIDNTPDGCFYDSETSFKSDTGRGEPRTTAEMMTRTTFAGAGWDFSTVWHMRDGVTYPLLQWQDLPPASPSPTIAPTPQATCTPPPTATPAITPTLRPTCTPTPTATPRTTPPPTPSGTAIPTPSCSPRPTTSPPPVPPWIFDYDGDGTSDIAIFRSASGLWAVRGITRAYFGGADDLPVPGDYNGDGTTDSAVFRESTGLWAVRGGERIYFGAPGDLPLPGDYAGNGTTDIGIFRPSSGLWAIRSVSRAYFGGSGDIPVPGYYGGDGSQVPGIFRPSTGLWALRGISRAYFGTGGDIPVPGDYAGAGLWTPAVFRPASGLWAVRSVTRAYFGGSADSPIPGGYGGDGTDRIGIFRPASGLWAIRGETRVYFGAVGDSPAAR